MAALATATEMLVPQATNGLAHFFKGGKVEETEGGRGWEDGVGGARQ